ncbi:MAG: hypothetical protein RL240_4491, partial [Planctomycetota bacterium]
MKNRMKKSKNVMFKNTQKHCVFVDCAGLLGVVSLSSMRVRAWELTKIPPATLRTWLNDGPIASHVSGLSGCLLESRSVALWKLLFRTHPSHLLACLLTSFAINRLRLRLTRTEHRVRSLAYFAKDRVTGPTVAIRKAAKLADSIGTSGEFPSPEGRGNGHQVRESLFYAWESLIPRDHPTQRPNQPSQTHTQRHTDRTLSVSFLPWKGMFMKIELWSLDRIRPYPNNPRINDDAV